MFFTPLTLPALVLFSQTIGASPLTADAGSKLPVADVRLVPANVNITFDARGAVHSDGTISSTLLACEALDCTECANIHLPTMFQTCIGMPPALSVAVTQQFGEALNYGVFVGPPTCGSFAQIPQINTCFNVNNGPFTDFFITE